MSTEWQTETTQTLKQITVIFMLFRSVH